MTGGVAIAAGQLGIVTNTEPDEGEYKLITLGPAGKTYYLRPRAGLAACERVIATYIDNATQAHLRWPGQGTLFRDFASQVSMLMIACHSVRLDGVGLKGGMVMEKAMKSKTATPRTGCQPATRIAGKTDRAPYVVPHITRHFILAADKLNVFDYKHLYYRDIEEYVPDVTKQAACKVAHLTLASIKDDFGLDPFHISCHLCFASQIDTEDLRAVLKLPYASFYEPIGKWITRLPAAGPMLHSHPPNLHSLLTALKAKTTTTAASDGEPDVAKGDGSKAKTRPKKAMKTTK